MRILLIEDEHALADALSELLIQNNFSVDTVDNGQDGLDYARSNIYDFILLDIMLPKLDGLTLLKTIRRENITTPVILLTAKSDVEDIVAGLDAGSDDYLAKPFSTSELLARLRALIRRSGSYSGEILSYEDLSFNKGTMEMCYLSDSIKLGLKEGQLLELLIKNPNQVIPKTC